MVSTKPIRIPEYFYKMILSWNPKLDITSKQVMISIAINDYNEKLKNMSLGKLAEVNSRNSDLCKLWIKNQWLDKDTRGLG